MYQALNADQLRPLYHDEPDALVALFREAVGVTAELIRSLDRPQRSKDETMHAAHELKGLCRTTGAEELAVISEEVEDLVRDDCWEEVEGRVAQLKDAHGRFAHAVEFIR